MDLGSFFPQEIKDNFAKRNIELGKTLLIEIPNFNISYKKYLIIVATNELYIAGVVINTEVNLNVAWSEKVKNLHLLIKQQDHSFLKYDSFLRELQITITNAKTISIKDKKDFGFL